MKQWWVSNTGEHMWAGTSEAGCVTPEVLSWITAWREKQSAHQVFTPLHSIEVERYTPLKCKHYFLVSTTLNPSDLQTTDCTSLFIDDWPNHKLLREKHRASFYMVISLPSSSFTAVSAWYGCVHIVPSSWSWWHSASFGRKLMTFALLQAMFFTYGLFGRIVRTWSDGGVQPKLLLSFCSALLSPSMMIQFLCSGWKSTAK